MNNSVLLFDESYKKLSIVVPYYEEHHLDMFPLLSSLNNQVGVDYSSIECILVNDGAANKLPDDFLKLFTNLQFKIIMLPENGGPGVARQAGLDTAIGEYVMFCDADDTLHSVGVLGAMMAEVEASKPDILITPWLEELHNEETGQMLYLTHEDDMTWMHGKLLRRTFLMEKNIRFHPELRVHEDSYFLSLACAATNNRRKLAVTSYVWRYISNSITRCNGASYTFDSIPTFLHAIDLSMREIIQFAPGEILYKVVQLVMNQYFCTHQDHWLLPENQGYRQQAEEAFREMIAPWFQHYRQADPAWIREVYNQERGRSFAGGQEVETLDQWLDRIGLLEMLQAN